MNWIKLENEKPAEYEDVLIYVITPGADCHVRVASRQEDDYWLTPALNHIKPDQVTHWQPLPSAPQ